MAILLRESDVVKLGTVDVAIEAVEQEVWRRLSCRLNIHQRERKYNS